MTPGTFTSPPQRLPCDHEGCGALDADGHDRADGVAVDDVEAGIEEREHGDDVAEPDEEPRGETDQGHQCERTYLTSRAVLPMALIASPEPE
ncbi:MAG TPA: hypothetical protein VLQ78_13650 [Ornithinibacter sp.]|nr:hypothetical protein [Ornithinibacter sp.]